MEERQEQIRSKGFDLTDSIRQYNSEGKDYTDYAKTKVGLRSIPDALIDVGTYNKVNSQFADKTYILNAVYRGDTEAMRKISNYYY